MLEESLPISDARWVWFCRKPIVNATGLVSLGRQKHRSYYQGGEQKLEEILRDHARRCPNPVLITHIRVRKSPLLRIGEVALRLGVHTNTVRRWGDMGLFKLRRIGPRKDRRFLKSDVDRFLANKD